ncbi:MAG: hypothetical protein NVSMB15_06870 [Steroidobacteraceae bacterium]
MREIGSNLAGKIALVTGATSGIGHAIALQLAGSGAALMLTGRNVPAGEALARELGGRFVAGDIAEPTFPDRLIAATLAAFGGLEITGSRRALTTCGSGRAARARGAP